MSHRTNRIKVAVPLGGINLASAQEPAAAPDA